MNIWDTSGEEKTKSLSRIYYRNASAAIVVFDLSSIESFKEVTFWINELKISADCDFILVGSKCDLEQIVDEKSIIDLVKTSGAAEYVKTSVF